ncbi:uncharacterized protein LOC121057862 isoform X1 [Cygnus olor]|uniref:uncharacterized protein LOC121057862 isoform X1 n=1 Tax=Cygnus olor TaxID=8869 RepID=UPI001ADE5B0E|nr:uncharacterized protein LOC121057862 isoform X1 [Cygnus olor]
MQGAATVQGALPSAGAVQGAVQGVVQTPCYGRCHATAPLFRELCEALCKGPAVQNAVQGAGAVQGVVQVPRKGPAVQGALRSALQYEALCKGPVQGVVRGVVQRPCCARCLQDAGAVQDASAEQVAVQGAVQGAVQRPCCARCSARCQCCARCCARRSAKRRCNAKCHAEALQRDALCKVQPKELCKELCKVPRHARPGSLQAGNSGARRGRVRGGGPRPTLAQRSAGGRRPDATVMGGRTLPGRWGGSTKPPRGFLALPSFCWFPNIRREPQKNQALQAGGASGVPLPASPGAQPPVMGSPRIICARREILLKLPWKIISGVSGRENN